MTARAGILFAFVFAVAAHGATTTGGTISARVAPTEAEVGLGFHGVTVRVEGEAPKGRDILLTVLGEREKMTFSSKRKAWAFWIAGEKVAFENAPALYIIKSSAPVGDVLPESKAREMALGKEGLIASLASSPSPVQLLGAREMVRLQRKLGLYETDGGGIMVNSDGSWAVDVNLPCRAPIGSYEITAVAVRGREVVSTASAQFVLKPSRSVALLAGFARSHGFVYGAVAVLLAIMSGLAAGGLFEKK